MKRVLLLALLIGCSAFNWACSKDSDSKEKTRLELITAGTWKFPSAMEGLDTCSVDDTWTFFSDHTLKQANGIISCNDDELPEYVGTWQFQENETKLNVVVNLNSQDKDTFNFTIVELNETVLKLKMEELIITLKK